MSYAQPITYGQVGAPLIIDLPTYVALDKGFFKKRNIDVAEPIKFSGSAISFIALIRGDIKIISASMFLALQDQYNNAPFLLGKPITYSASYLYVKPSIKSVSELKGKTITAGGQSDITRMQAEIMLEANGVTDVNWFWSPDSAKRLLALTSGQLDAAILIPPYNLLAEKEGFVKLSKVGDYKLTYHKGLVFNKEWGNKNINEVKSFVDAINEAIFWIYNTNNRNEASQILSKHSGISLEDAIKSYDQALEEKYFIADDSISQSQIDYFVSVARKWGNIKQDNIPLEKLILNSMKISP